MPTPRSSKSSGHLIRRRGLAAVGGVIGATAGTAFMLLVAGAGAVQGGAAEAVFDATHLPPLLTTRGERVELRYDVHCAPTGEDSDPEACDATGSVFVRPGTRGSFSELPLRVDETAAEGRHVAVVPSDIATNAHGFTYYSEFESEEVGTTITLPAGGAQSPQRSVPLLDPIDVSLGTHTFGRTQVADARVADAAWGDGPTVVGLEGGRNLPHVGGSAFDVDSKRTVHLLDQVHRRILEWSVDGTGPVALPLAIDGTVADLAVASDGSIYVLEGARESRGPVLRTFGATGERRTTVAVSDRTASQVRMGPSGPIVLQHPSGQWMPMPLAGHLAPTLAQRTAGRPGRALPGGGEVVVLRRGAEIRALLTDSNGARRSWRVASSTSLAEVQLAEPLGSRLLLVVRLYTGGQDEFVALVLGPNGLVHRRSIASADWAETAPLSRFRLVGSSLYQLGSTPSGVFVDRHDLEAQ